jgi:hypothetical protein
MKIKVEFTVDVPREDLEALRELANADTNARAAEFVRSDVIEYVHQYLGSNGVNNIKITEPWERRNA